MHTKLRWHPFKRSHNSVGISGPISYVQGLYTLVGCPLLLMLWTFERFNIGRPTLSSYDLYGDDLYNLDEFGVTNNVDMPKMGTLWFSQDVSTDTSAYSICLHMLLLMHVLLLPL